MNTKITLFTILAICTLFSSCSDNDGDTTAPVITLNAPVEGAQLTIGSSVHFDMEVSDNEMLKSYKVEIHENMSSPHTHTRSEDIGYFSYNNTWDISVYKSLSIHHHEIEIPAEAIPGNYHFMVYCLDAAGNESHVARNVVLVVGDGDEEDDDHDHDHE